MNAMLNVLEKCSVLQQPLRACLQFDSSLLKKMNKRGIL